MEDEGLGMGLFLDDEFFEDTNESLDPPEKGENIQNIDEDDVDDTKLDLNNTEDLDEDESSDKVGEDDTEDDDDLDDKEDDTSSPPLYKSLASYLHTEGVLTSVDPSELEKVESIQDLANLITKEVKSKELIDLTDLQKQAVEAFRAGINIEAFQKQKTIENNLDSITDDILTSDQDLREKLIYQDFINQGFSEQKAQRLTSRSVGADDDIEDAREALENIKKGVKDKFDQEKQYNLKETEDAQIKYDKDQALIKKNILEKEEPIKGIKINEAARKQVLSNMLNPVGKNPTTGNDENSLMKDQRENEDFNQRLYTVYTLSKGFTDFSYFGKKEKNNTVKDIERALKNNQHITTGGSPDFLDDSNSSDFEIGDKIVF